MTSSSPPDVLILGAGASGLMAARTLAQGGRRVTLLEAKPRCGGRIFPLSVAEFGYKAEAGAEYIHGAAPVTRGLLDEAGLSAVTVSGRRWSLRNGAWVPREAAPHEDRFLAAMKALQTDLPVGEFVAKHFAGPEYEALRQLVARETEGYNAADLDRFSTFALRDQWLDPHAERQERVVEGYGALVDFLAGRCREAGVAIHLDTAVTGIEVEGERVVARCHGGAVFAARAAILTAPLPVLRRLTLPADLRERVAAADAATGFGDVVKFHLRFREAWWLREPGGRFADLGFLLGAETAVPVWWTQYPALHPVLTGWCSGPKLAGVAALPPEERIGIGLASVAEIFRRPVAALRQELVAARATHWGEDPFARGAYSYPTLETQGALAALRKTASGAVHLCGEALYVDGETGTVEAALASGLATARALLAGR